MKVIETSYQGYNFRSRLEARWAVFMDTLDVRWTYEPEGYDLGEAGWYLPDFYLPRQEVFVEIKPELEAGVDWPSVAVMDKAIALEDYTGKQVVVICGSPGPVADFIKGNPYQGFVKGDNNYYWCECLSCGAVGLQYDGRAERNNHNVGCPINRETHEIFGSQSLRITLSWNKARAARFEHRNNTAVMAAKAKTKVEKSLAELEALLADYAKMFGYKNKL